MIQLSIEQFPRVTSLLENERVEKIYAQMVLEGREKGQIFVDNKENPSACLIIHEVSAFAVLTGENADFSFAADAAGMLLKPKVYRSPIKLSISKEPWQRVINGLLGDKRVSYDSIRGMFGTQEETDKELSLLSADHVIEREREKYVFKKQKFLSKSFTPPEGYTIRRIDLELIKKLSGSVSPDLYWQTEEAFLSGGAGFCLMKGEDVVSTSFSAFAAAGSVDVGVETSPEYRGRGLGVYAPAAMIQYCIDRGLQPYWDCRKDNPGSSRLADKLGFELELIHPYYFGVK